MKRRTTKNIVTVWDKSANTFTNIPRAELAPGMVKIDLAGKGIVWASAESLKGALGGEFRHPPFDDELKSMFANIKVAFDPYYSQTLQEWEDGFRRDANPEHEIAMWLHAAGIIRKHATGDPTPRNQEVFQLIMTAMTNGTADALLTFTAEHLSKAEIAAIIGSDADS